MAAHTLNILTPSVNNLSARILVRAAGLDEEKDGGRRPSLPREVPRPPDADAGRGRRARRRELRDRGLPLQQERPRPVLSDRSGPAGDGRQRDVLSDRHGVSAGRARHVPDARLRPVPGRGGDLRGRRRDEGEGAQGRRGRARGAARRLPLVLPRRPAVHRRRPPVDRRHPAGRRSSSCGRSTTTSRSGRRIS